MDKTKKFDLKTFLTLLAVLVLSLTILVTSGCNNNTTSSSSSSSSSADETVITDYQTLTNGDFEFGTTKTEAESYPVSTGINWSRANDSLSTAATSSDYSSGIIDTTDASYKAIAVKNAFPIESGEGDSAVYFNPHTPYYYGLVKNSYAYSEDKSNDDKLPTTGNKVLMIHNELKSSSGKGTAQKFTSAKTIDIEADSYAKVSVWVLTKNLKTVMDTNDFGAYVSLINIVNTTKNPLVVKNINTKGEWAQVSFYVEGSDLCASSYRLVLGLGNGSRKLTSEYCEGFAYFDNAVSESISYSDYKTATDAIASENKFNIFVPDANDATLLADATANQLQASLTGATISDNGDASENGAYVSTKTPTVFNYSISYNMKSVSAGNVFATAENNSKYYTHADASFGASSEIGSSAFSAISSKVTGVKNPLGNDAETLYMIYPKGASHTAYTKDFALKDESAMLLTFYAKVECEDTQTGVTVSVLDKGTATTTADTITAIASKFNTSSYENENTENWVKFFVYVTNNIGDGSERTFKLKIDFGPTEAVSDPFILPDGYAMFTGFETTALTLNQYDVGTNSSTYAGKVSLGADLASKPTETTDTYSLSYSASDNAKIQNDLSDSVIGYTGVVGGHTMVGGENTAYSQASTVSGIFNNKYLTNYSSLSDSEKTLLNTLTVSGENQNVQALLINNKTASSYGYIGSSNSLTSATNAVIAVKLRVFGDAKAYVYLANANPLEGFDVLGIAPQKWTFANDTVTYPSNETFFNKQFVQTVSASDCTDGWTTVYFSIKSGIDPINYRVEVWNGSRDGSEKSIGMVAVESISTNGTLVLSEIKSNNVGGTIVEESYQRVPTLVTSTNDAGKDVTSYTQYNPSVVYTEYTKAKAIVADFTTVNAQNEIDNTTDSSDDTSSSDSTSTETTSNPNIAVEVISIIISGVLILVLIILVVRLILKNHSNKKAVVNQYYNPESRNYTNKKIAYNKAKANAENASSNEQTSDDETSTPNADETASEEEMPAYDYDNMENNLPQDAVETANDANASETTETASEEEKKD